MERGTTCCKDGPWLSESARRRRLTRACRAGRAAPRRTELGREHEAPLGFHARTNIAEAVVIVRGQEHTSSFFQKRLGRVCTVSARAGAAVFLPIFSFSFYLEREIERERERNREEKRRVAVASRVATCHVSRSTYFLYK